jgi:hypothetical protein
MAIVIRTPGSRPLPPPAQHEPKQQGDGTPADPARFFGPRAGALMDNAGAVRW